MNKQLDDSFRLWLRNADVPKCNHCRAKPAWLNYVYHPSHDQTITISRRLYRFAKLFDKPILLPDFLKDKSIDNCFQGRCYRCAEKEYEKNTNNTGDSFFEAFRKLLTQKPQPVYFFNENLQDVNFSGLTLECSGFLCCDLTRSNFRGAEVSKSNFLGSLLNNTLFSNATLEEACMLGCQADYALITSANLKRIVAGLGEDSLKSIQSKLSNKLSDNWFKKAWKEGPRRKEKPEEGKKGKNPLTEKWYFSGRESNLSASNLTDAKLINCALAGTAFNFTRLQGVDFTGAELQDSSLSHVSLGNTKFIGAQLSGVDLTSSFTPDPASAPEIDDATVYFDGSILQGSLLRNCYFLRATFNGVQAQRLDCRGVVFGPGSSLSGNFSNSRFGYAYLAGCDLGSSELKLPINLRDADFSHAQFIEISIHASDLASAIFARSRFEDRTVYQSTHEKENAENQKRNKLFSELLETTRGGEYISSITGTNDYKYNDCIEPPAINFDCAHIGTIRIENISFVTANFTNSLLRLTLDSKCSFRACNFNNAIIALPAHSLENEYMLDACSFHNGIIAERQNPENYRILRGCAFNATAFMVIDDNNEFTDGADAKNFKFIECTFEQTPLDKYFQDSLKKLVLMKCRFLNGQYLGLYDKKTTNRRDSEKKVLGTARELIENTIKFNDPASPNNSPDEDYADQQFLWNMFATNFRQLAIPWLESECLCNLRDLDLLSISNSHINCNHIETSKKPMSWGGSIAHSLSIFIIALGAAALLAGSSGNWIPKGFPVKFLQTMIAGIVLLVILTIPILWGWGKGNFKKESFFQSLAQWQTIYSKSIYYYGEKPSRSLLSWGVIIGVFGSLYFLTGLASQNDWVLLGKQFDIHVTAAASIFPQNKTYAFLNSLYFSLIVTHKSARDNAVIMAGHGADS